MQPYKKERKMREKRIFFEKYLHNSKKSSNFAGFFARSARTRAETILIINKNKFTKQW